MILPYRQEYLTQHNKAPITVYDRNGIVLMEITGDKNGLSQTMDIAQVPEEFVRLLLFSEDRNFYHHWGVSVKGLARALCQNIKAMRIVSGGSTITQQLVKSKRQILHNSILSKLTELIEAIRLELHYCKEEILQAYINEIYLGNNIYGFEKAAQIYFDKHLHQCDLLEQAFLISMVKAPEKYNPYKNPDTIVQHARMLLNKASQGYIRLTPLQKEIYMNKKISLQYGENVVCAPLFCLYALSRARKMFPDIDITRIYTTLDATLYKEILAIVRNSLSTMKDKNALHAALIIIDTTTMEIIAMIGSIDFFDYGKGQIDATLIKKQAASTMKPFAYALALDKGVFHTSSILPDVYMQFYSKVGAYIPKNFSQSYHGPVCLAKALGCSYNIPAVYVANTVGIVPLYNFLKTAGFDSIHRSPSFYGLGMVLGNAEVTLLELANAYTIFPREGVFNSAHAILKVVDKEGKEYIVPQTKGTRLLRSSTCFLINHILSDYKYKIEAFGLYSAIHFPFPFAVKTGTSKDFHDNFVAGYNNKYTIAVWVGNLYNKSMEDLPAVSGAGIVLKDVLLYLWNAGYQFPPFKPLGKIKKIMICKLSGMVAGEHCHDTYNEYFDENNFPAAKCTWHLKNKIVVPVEYKEWATEKKIPYTQSEKLRIIFPNDGAVFKIEKAVRKNLQAIPLKAIAPGGKIIWYIDDKPIGIGTEIIWTLSKGEHTITVENNNEKNSVKISVLE